MFYPAFGKGHLGAPQVMIKINIDTLDHDLGLLTKVKEVLKKMILKI